MERNIRNNETRCSRHTSDSFVVASSNFNASKLILGEFRCSFPLSDSSKSSVRRLTSAGQSKNDRKIYQEIKGTLGVRESSPSPGSSFTRECLAATTSVPDSRRTVQTTMSSSGSYSSSISYRPNNTSCTAAADIKASFGAEASLDKVSADAKETLDLKKDDPSNISAVLALYAKVDILQKRQQRKLLTNEAKLGTTEVATPPAATSSSSIETTTKLTANKEQRRSHEHDNDDTRTANTQTVSPLVVDSIGQSIKHCLVIDSLSSNHSLPILTGRRPSAGF